MAERTFKSAGVYATEIDLSQPTTTAPTGIPAGVIGTADEGQAFIPITVGNFSDFIAVYGASDGEKFGPLAVYEFLKNAQACTYLRVLGVGDGKRRSDSTGMVTNAGFTVGSEMIQDNGNVSNNPKANDGGNLGRTYFLGCFMSESDGSTIFSDAGIQTGPTASCIIRGVLMAPSGVVVQLSGNSYPDGMSSKPARNLIARSLSASTWQRLDINGNTLMGGLTGSVDLRTQQFVMLLNGHVGSDSSPNVLTASFDMEDASYFANVFNTDPLQIQEKGHVLYSHYDIHPAWAAVTSSGLTSNEVDFSHGKGAGLFDDAAFITTGSEARNGAGSGYPNYESFADRFTHAAAPFVISQTFGAIKYDLFRVHAIGDGAFMNTRIKISIENVTPSTSDVDKFGRFDLRVRKFTDDDREVRTIEKFLGLTLNPSDDKYIARAIGDRYTYFDFDQATDSQKLVTIGDHPLRSNFIRVEIGQNLANGNVPDDALPFGYRGYSHIVSSGSNPVAGIGPDPINCSTGLTNRDWLKSAVEPPVPVRNNIAVGVSNAKRVNASLYWGTQFSSKRSLTEPNARTVPEKTIANMTKFLPGFYPAGTMNFSVGNNPGKADTAGTVLDCDTFNNNVFTLERIKIRTGSDTYADVTEWASASYVRNGVITANESQKTRALSVTDLKKRSGNRRFAKYSFFLQGGFDGTDMFNEDKSKLLNAAAKREVDDSNSQGGVDGATVATYRKALDIMGTKSDVDIKLLAIPGLRHKIVTDYAIDVVESRFDALYLMDIEERDQYNNVITGSASNDLNIANTVASFQDRALDTSFASAYFPDVIMVDPSTRTNVRCPPSVAVLGAFSLNDAIGYPWFAPAGFSRGALNRVLFTALPLNRTNLDDLYEADINPLTSFPGTGVVVFGQKTLLGASSALDRVNVRRLLIDIRRKVRHVADLMLFEPNRQETLDKFNALVQPILQSIQERSGVDRYKVVIDATTTTQADIENNTLRGKIFIQPTRTAEFVSLDFVVTNAGDAFSNA
jgi:phage tail sheath protein FI